MVLIATAKTELRWCSIYPITDTVLLVLMISCCGKQPIIRQYQLSDSVHVIIVRTLHKGYKNT